MPPISRSVAPSHNQLIQTDSDPLSSTSATIFLYQIYTVVDRD